jgi:hypothetical protein
MSRVAIALIAICLPALAQDHRRVDCNAQFQFAKRQVDVSASYLQKISLSLKLPSETLAQLNVWTTVALDQQRALCDAYKTSSEAQFPTSVYLDQLAQLRSWETDFLKLAMGAQQVTDSKAAAASSGGRGPGASAFAQEKAKLSEDIKVFLASPPKVAPPGK